MLSWSVNFTKEAEGELSKLNSSVRNRVIDKIQWLEDNCDSIFHKELSKDLKSSYKLRVGDWRVVYKLENKSFIIVIIKIDHRSKVYKAK